MAACASTEASQPSKQQYDFVTQPPGAKAVIGEYKAGRYTHLECMTPCSLRARPHERNYFSLTKAGYVSEWHLPEQAVAQDGVLRFDVEMTPLFPDRQEVVRIDPCDQELLEGLESDSESQVCRRIQPGYPTAAMARGLEGDCEVNLGISKDGSVSTVHDIVCSSPEFEPPTRRAMDRWRFIPERKDGAFVNTENRLIIIRFRLNDYIEIAPPDPNN